MLSVLDLLGAEDFLIPRIVQLGTFRTDRFGEVHLHIHIADQ